MVHHTFFNGQLVERHIPIHISICLTIDSVILSKKMCHTYTGYLTIQYDSGPCTLSCTSQN